MEWYFFRKTCVHLVVWLNYIQINFKHQLMPPNAKHHEYILAHVTKIAEQVLINMYTILTPNFVNVKLVQNITIMVRLWVLEVQVYEKSIVVHHHHVVNEIHFFPPIK
jgi:hypothetical protein